MPTEDLVQAILKEHFGFNVEKIRESDEQRPDFLAYNDVEKYLIEVKEKQNPRHEAG